MKKKLQAPNLAGCSSCSIALLLTTPLQSQCPESGTSRWSPQRWGHCAWPGIGEPQRTPGPAEYFITIFI